VRAVPLTPSAGGPRQGPRSRAAALSIVSNSALIVLKIVAGAVTGSVAIITEAIHSAIDLIASIIAFFSVREAESPADARHRYGHEKFENVAAAAEGVLILVGSGVIVYAAVGSLVNGPELESLGFGIAVVGFSAVVNFVVSSYLFRRARATDSPALEGDAAHLRTDAYTSFGVLVGLALVQWTGQEWLDPVVALMIAVAIVVTGLRIVARSWRVLVDEALPEDEIAAITEAIAAFETREVAGYHQLRTRRAGARRYVDLHVQFRAGTTLERAHAAAHELQHEIGRRLRGADVLIHLEPEDAVRPDADPAYPAGPHGAPPAPHGAPPAAGGAPPAPRDTPPAPRDTPPPAPGGTPPPG
jgi:cation diffusion facilitator family transporter